MAAGNLCSKGRKTPDWNFDFCVTGAALCLRNCEAWTNMQHPSLTKIMPSPTTVTPHTSPRIFCTEYMVKLRQAVTQSMITADHDI